MIQHDSHFSFMIVPPRGHKTLTLRLPKWSVYSLATLMLLSLILLATGLYLNINSPISNSELKNLKIKTSSQHKDLKTLHYQVDELKTSIYELIEKEEDIRLQLGDTNKKTHSRYKKHYKKKRLKANAFKQVYKELKQDIARHNNASDKQQLWHKIHYLSYTIQELEHNYLKLSERTRQYKTRFSSTPSIRPLYGRIRSNYGWRRHPITGKKQFHRGIDIPSWHGAPIQATADGIVEYANWSGNFGYLAILNHNFGYRTLYAHCSQLLVKKGQHVKKGQVIAQVGSTGLSTGPHLHYEVRKWRKSVPPTKYLDLDLYTARVKIW